MAKALDAKLLDRLDALVARHRLHDGPALQPVSLERVMEAIDQEYRWMPKSVLAMTLRWETCGKQYVSITYNSSLRKPSASAARRHAKAHEYAHVLCGHPGDTLVMRWRGQEPELFDLWSEKADEQQCEYVAAYLLVPVRALREMEGMEQWYIARKLDVPEHLVGLRWRIWQKWDR